MKRFLSLLLTAGLVTGLTVPVSAAEFSDVSSGHWAREAIASCERQKIVSGYSDGTFRPNGTVTNAQFIVMLTRAFYPKEVAKYAEMEWAGYESWWWPNWRVALDEQFLVLTDLTGVESFKQQANQPMTRTDMAQVLWNLLKAKGFSVSQEQREAAQSKISDWRSIRVTNREGVLSVYALGVVGGLSNGTFGGGSYMNRAQGCTVIERAGKLIAAGPSAAALPTVQTPAVPKMPAAPQEPASSAEPRKSGIWTPPEVDWLPEDTQTETETPVSPQQPAAEQKPSEPQQPAATQKPSEPQQPAAAQKPSEPQQPAAAQKPSEPQQTAAAQTTPKTSGVWTPPETDWLPESPSAMPEKTKPVLTNGREVTEENVLALLAELKKAYPDGMFWDGATVREGTPSKALNDTIKRSYFHYQGGMVSMTRGCGGFASLLSDAVFGSGDANPARKLDSLADVRPGDILMKLNASGGVTHVVVAAARPSGTEEFRGVTAWRIPVRGGNGNDLVYSFDSIVPGELANGMYYEAWTRYPAE